MIEGLETLRAVQRPLAEASHAPGFLYASPEVFRREVERLFMRDWRYVARVEELPHPGDYMTLGIAGEPLVIARDQAGTLHACYNMCVHRGVEVAGLWQREGVHVPVPRPGVRSRRAAHRRRVHEGGERRRGRPDATPARLYPKETS